MESTVCPICGKDDRIQKVSSLHAQGIAYTEGSGFAEPGLLSPQPRMNVRVEQTTQTTLSKKLSLPQKSKLGPRCLSIGGLCWLIFGCLAVEILGSRGSDFQNILILIVVGSLVLLGVAVAIGFAMDALSAPAEKNAIAVWNRLYYCFRDDCVFDPVTNAWAPLNKMKDLLYGSPSAPVQAPQVSTSRNAVQAPNPQATVISKSPEISSPTQSVASKKGTVEDRLQKLKQLRTDGIITEEEYNRKRNEILNEL